MSMSRSLRETGQLGTWEAVTLSIKRQSQDPGKVKGFYTEGERRSRAGPGRHSCE